VRRLRLVIPWSDLAGAATVLELDGLQLELEVTPQDELAAAGSPAADEAAREAALEALDAERRRSLLAFEALGAGASGVGAASAGAAAGAAGAAAAAAAAPSSPQPGCMQQWVTQPPG
jgi:hypothetical protein